MQYEIVNRGSYFAIVGFTILVFVASQIVIENLGYFDHQYTDTSRINTDATGSVYALALRYNFLAFNLAYFAVCAACIIFCALDLLKRFRKNSLRIIAVGVVLIAFVLWFFLFWLVGQEAVHRTHDLVGTDLYEQALASMKTASPSFGDIFETYLWLTDINKYIAMIVSGLLVVGGVAIACSAPVPLPQSRRPLLTCLQLQAGDFKRYVFLSSIYMVFGILQIQSALRLPAYAFVDEVGQADFSRLVDSIVFFYAITFSLILAVFAVPSLLVMRENSERLVAGSLREEAADYPDALSARMRWLGFGVFSVDGVQSLIAIVAPLIAGSMDLSKLF